MDCFYNTPNLSQHKSKWTPEEDRKLLDAVAQIGTDSWIRVSQRVPGRNSKQCRERWMGQLSPDIVKTSWSPEEDEILIKQHSLIGNKWTLIATMLPGRSAINVKNRWSRLKRHRSINSFNIYPQPQMDFVPSQPKMPNKIIQNVNISKVGSTRSTSDSENEVLYVKAPPTPALFEFPSINANMFGEDFLRFQAQMFE